jgi:phage terminase large subunit-like protein
MNDYISEYEKAIIDGKIQACREIKKALKRDKRDRRRAKKDDFPYYFNEALAEQAINFIQILPTAEGTPLKLELFQKFLVSELFGWRKKSDDTRRYSECFISFSRKNGKSFLLSCIASIYLLIENKPPQSREILFTANTFKQAKIAFNMFKHGLRQLAKESPTIRQRLKINDAEVFDLTSNSHAVAMASNLQALDGYRSDLAVIDEYALATDRNIKEVIKTGQINSDNALLAVISTSGNNLNSPMYKDYQFAKEILDGKKQADDLFIAIYEQDYKNEVIKALKDPMLLEKSNPLLANADRRSVMLPKLINSINLASEQDNLLPVYVKNANLWLQNRENSYIPVKDWEKETIDTPNISKKPVWFGIDLSKDFDLTSVSWLIPFTQDKDKKFLFADSHSWVGTKYGLDEKIKRDHFDYRKGQERGECSITKLESGVIDYDEIFQYILRLVDQYDLKVQGVCYDPYRFGELIPKFEKKTDWQLIQVRQGRKTLAQPTMQFREDLFNHKIKHDDNQLLKYAVNNAVIVYDRLQNPLIDKAKSQNKIDPLASLMNAYTQAKAVLVSEKVQHDSDYFASDQFSF